QLCLSPRSVRGLGPLTRVRHLCHRQTFHSEEYDDEEDKEIEESYDSNSVSEDAEDEDPATGTRLLLRGSRAPAAPVVGITVSAPLGLGYGALRLRELALEEDYVYSTFETDLDDDMVYIDVPAYPSPAPPVQTPPSPEWTSGSLPISPSPFVVPSPISSPMILLTVPSSVATPATAETESLKYELERVVVKFEAIWRPVLALESWASQTDAHRAALWHAISDMQGENRDLRLQLAEERRARLELAKVVDSMRRGQEPRGAQFCPYVSALRLVAGDRADTHFLIRIWRTM
ncbi:hypothetical protein Tco_0550719, partial [Tanacetum coccineum]